MTLVVIPEPGVYFASSNDAIILKPTTMGVSVTVAMTALNEQNTMAPAVETAPSLNRR